MTKKLMLLGFCVCVVVLPLLAGCGGGEPSPPSGKSVEEVEAEIQANYKKLMEEKAKKK